MVYIIEYSLWCKTLKKYFTKVVFKTWNGLKLFTIILMEKIVSVFEQIAFRTAFKRIMFENRGLTVTAFVSQCANISKVFHSTFVFWQFLVFHQMNDSKNYFLTIRKLKFPFSELRTHTCKILY